MTQAAVYARYSSDNQRDASIEDQVRQCRARIDREDWTLTQGRLGARPRFRLQERKVPRPP